MWISTNGDGFVILELVISKTTYHKYPFAIFALAVMSWFYFPGHTFCCRLLFLSACWSFILMYPSLLSTPILLSKYNVSLTFSRKPSLNTQVQLTFTLLHVPLCIPCSLDEVIQLYYHTDLWYSFAAYFQIMGSSGAVLFVMSYSPVIIQCAWHIMVLISVCCIN